MIELEISYTNILEDAMKIKINTKIIQALNPCSDRLDNWMKYYPNFNSDIVKFLDLPEITHSDKMWVALRLIPGEMCVVFAMDCSFSAPDDAAITASYAANAAYYADDASCYAAYFAASAYASAYASHAADYAIAAAAHAAASAANADSDYDDVARIKEQESQIEALKYLILGE